MNKDNVIWFDEFYKKITLKKYGVEEIINMNGSVERTNVINGIRNNFLTSFDNEFRFVCVTENISHNAVVQISFYDENLLIPFIEVQKYSIAVEKHFIIYDEKVEYTFSTMKNDVNLKSIVCTAEESNLDNTDIEDERLVFNNISFVFST